MTLRSFLRKLFPGHWSFLLGELALFSFVGLVLSGVFLALFYTPSADLITYHGGYPPFVGRNVPAAFSSIVALSIDVPMGLVMRRFHHFCAHLFLLALVLHAARVFFTGAFRRPRRLTYWLGLALLGLALVNGYTGYCMPFDVRGGAATRMLMSTLTSVPWVGGWLATLVFGAPYPGPYIVPRLYIEHVFIGPLLLFMLIGVHLALVVYYTHTDYPGAHRSAAAEVGAPAWPDQGARSSTVALLVFGFAALLSAFFPVEAAWVYGPWQPVTYSGPLTPDWFLLWIEGAYRLLPHELDFHLIGANFTNPFYGAVILPTLVFAVCFLWPFIDERLYPENAQPHHLLERWWTRPARAAVGLGGLLFLVLVSMGSLDTEMASAFHSSLEKVRILWGAITLGLPPVAGLLLGGVLRRKLRAARPSA